MMTFAEINEVLDRTARYNAEAARRDAERAAVVEKETAELRVLLAESARRNEESARRNEEAARRDEERKAAAEQRDAEWKRERDAMIRRMDEERFKTDEAIRKSVNQFDKNWGNLVEAFANNQLIRLFVDRGIRVTDNSMQNIVGTIDGRLYEVDSILVNSDTAVVIEIKTTLNTVDVDKFLFKLQNFREGFTTFEKFQIILGGMAYIRGKPEAVQYAQDNGLFTILATGESARIVNAANFVPQKWGT